MQCEVVKDIHLFMWYANHVYTFTTDEIKHKVFALRKAIKTFMYIGSVLPKQWVLRKPFKASFKLF